MEEKYINTSPTQRGCYASDHYGASPRCDINSEAYGCPVWQANSPLPATADELWEHYNISLLC